MVISHGENLKGGYQYNGTLNAGVIASGTQELNNHADNAYPIGSATTFLVDDIPSYADANTHFDDFVLRASIMSVASKAQLGPRAY